MQTRLKAVCQMVERNNGIFRALFVTRDKSQEETILVNLGQNRGLPKEGQRFLITFSPVKDNGR